MKSDESKSIKRYWPLIIGLTVFLVLADIGIGELLSLTGMTRLHIEIANSLARLVLWMAVVLYLIRRFAPKD